MPKKTDIKSVLILGAGPIVIGQACEFDYSGTQACKALKEEGCRVILVNSNPATIMTDPELADATYIEPILPEVVAKIIAKERPDALLPTMGGQTALNCALALAQQGVLAEYGVQLIGAHEDAIAKAEDRELFRQAMQRIGLEVPRSTTAHNLQEALAAQQQVGYPTIIRPSFTMGGTGGGIAYNHEEFIEICERGLDASPTNELLIEQSVIGWKEFEMEVVRDPADNCIIVCTIENIDAMGVHTGDSITVAPAQTLTDKEYQVMRNAAIAVLREIGVDTGGANVQFAVDPKTGRLLVIEMNPRVSRSSALASKATGFPIAKIAAKLALGYHLSELKNEMTGGLTPASFEPSIDYVVTKIPRFNFEKFPEADARLTTQMKSVGEVMAIGRTFAQSLQKAMRGLEIGVDGFTPKITQFDEAGLKRIRSELCNPEASRLWYLGDALRAGLSIAEIHSLSHIDPWFLVEIAAIINMETRIQQTPYTQFSKSDWQEFKQQGFADSRIAVLQNTTEKAIRLARQALGVRPAYKRIDTCAAEFATNTAYLYSSYDEECEAEPSNNRKVMILGGGPNRIGQGIEFDYCCVHAAMALREVGFETIMVNCNPETVSTDYDLSDRLYFESLTLEDVLEITELEKPAGVIVQYGGQTPLKLACALGEAGVPIIGTSPEAIDLAEDRERFQQVLQTLGLRQPENGIARTLEQGLQVASQIGYPLVVRPSYVLGGRAMQIVFDETELKRYWQNAVIVTPDAPVLLDRFLDDAIEVDVDAVCDGTNVLIGGLMEHIEQAGIHSGDSACSLPSFSLSVVVQDELRRQVKMLAQKLGVIGLMNAQFAIKGDDIFVLEVNPRAARTVPFVSKATGVALAKIAAKVMVGIDLKAQNKEREIYPSFYAIKQVVFPFAKFPGVDPLLGPEMKSTGEVMGMAKRFGAAFAKGQLGGGHRLPNPGKVFVSVRAADKPRIAEIAKALVDLGFEVVATRGTAHVILAAGVNCAVVNKVNEGRPHIVDMIKNDDIVFIINTTEGQQANADSCIIRRSAVMHKVNYTTTLAGAKAMLLALKDRHFDDVMCLQDWIR